MLKQCSICSSGTADAVSAVEGKRFSNTAIAHITDLDPSDQAGDLTATINWGDGSTVEPANLIGSGGGFDVMGSHLYKHAGDQSLTVTVSDGQEQSVSVDETITVTHAAIVGAGSTISPLEGIPYTAVVANFVDANPFATADEFIPPTIHWGDGQSDDGTLVSQGGGAFAVTGRHAYAHAGNFAVGVTITDEGGGQELVTTATGLAHVRQSVINLRPRYDLKAVEGVSISLELASFTDSNPLSTAAEFHAIVNFGGLETEEARVVGGDGHFLIYADHTFEDPGGQIVTVTLTRDAHESTGAALVRVADAALQVGNLQHNGTVPAISVDDGPYITPEGWNLVQIIDFDPHSQLNDLSAMIHWGDGSTSAGTITLNSPQNYDVTGPSHAYEHGYEYPANRLWVEVTDTEGAWYSQSDFVQFIHTGSGIPPTVETAIELGARAGG